MEMSISLSHGVLKWVYFADCKHMDNQHDIYLFTAQLMGGGVLLWLSYIGGTPLHLPLCL